MNQLYGAKVAGKRRLAALSAQEKDAAANPLLGRSRAERLLDASLREASSEDLNAIMPVRKAAKTSTAVPRAARTSPPEARQGGARQPAASVIYCLLRRLELDESKFARTCELIRRCFRSEEGAQMLTEWREVIQAGRQAAQRSAEIDKLVKRAVESQAWIIFFAAWRLALSPHVAENGDSRANVMWLFETVFLLDDESPVEAIQTARFGHDGLEQAVDLPADELRKRLGSKPARPVSLRLHPLPGAPAQLDDARTWLRIYETLVPVCRISALAHNMLYLDDNHLFNRGLQFLAEVEQHISANAGVVLDDSLVAELDSVPPIANVEEKDFEWQLPSEPVLWFWRRKLLLQSLPTVFQNAKRPWARPSVLAFINGLFRHRASKYTLLEADQIEEYQSRLLAQQTADSNHSSDHKIVLPGVAPIPIKDVRKEIITSDSGVSTWANRQLT